MPYSCKVAIFLSASIFPTLLAAQSVSKDTYDFDFIGQPLADPVLQHAKETYVLFGCAYCHGIDLVSRGEATDLMHSRLVGRDANGNLIGPLLRAGIPQTAKLSPMPQFSDLSDQQIGLLVRWIHYARAQGRFKELSGGKDTVDVDPVAGRAYFDQNCSTCHSLSGDLAGVASKYSPAQLKSKVLKPVSLDDARSWNTNKAKDSTRDAGTQRHQALLEKYSAQEVANLLAVLRALR